MTITPLGRGTFRITDATRSRLAFAAVDGTRTWVFLEGRSYLIHDDAPRGGSRAARHDDDTALSSPMPATVADVRIAPGDQVSRGQILVVLEAMKMELPIRAPRDGVIRSVDCRAGALVQPGVPLLAFEP